MGDAATLVTSLEFAKLNVLRYQIMHKTHLSVMTICYHTNQLRKVNASKNAKECAASLGVHLFRLVPFSFPM